MLAAALRSAGCVVLLWLSGCTASLIVAPIAGVATVVGARTPSHELEQVYYFGVFDPAGQMPPILYRIRVRGQSGAISDVRFASGWVPAPVVDSLGSRVEETGIPAQAPRFILTRQTQDRRLVLFGPEGFREAPRDHRLVIVAGSNPDAFFRAVDEALAGPGQ
jgi:hypothetical protein